MNQTYNVPQLNIIKKASETMSDPSFSEQEAKIAIHNMSKYVRDMFEDNHEGFAFGKSMTDAAIKMFFADFDKYFDYAEKNPSVIEVMVLNKYLSQIVDGRMYADIPLKQNFVSELFRRKDDIKTSLMDVAIFDPSLTKDEMQMRVGDANLKLSTLSNIRDIFDLDYGNQPLSPMSRYAKVDVWNRARDIYEENGGNFANSMPGEKYLENFAEHVVTSGTSSIAPEVIDLVSNLIRDSFKGCVKEGLDENAILAGSLTNRGISNIMQLMNNGVFPPYCRNPLREAFIDGFKSLGLDLDHIDEKVTESKTQMDEICRSGKLKSREDLGKFLKGMQILRIKNFMDERPESGVDKEYLEFYIQEAITNKGLSSYPKCLERVVEEFGRHDMQEKGIDLSDRKYTFFCKDGLDTTHWGGVSFRNTIEVDSKNIYGLFGGRDLYILDTIFHENRHQEQDYAIDHTDNPKYQTYKVLMMQKEEILRRTASEFYDTNYGTIIKEIDAREYQNIKTLEFLNKLRLTPDQEQDLVDNMLESMSLDLERQREAPQGIMEQTISARKEERRDGQQEEHELYYFAETKRISSKSDGLRVNDWLQMVMKKNPSQIPRMLTYAPMLKLEFQPDGNYRYPASTLNDLYNGTIISPSVQSSKLVREMLFRNDAFKPKEMVSDLEGLSNVSSFYLGLGPNSPLNNQQIQEDFMLIISENFSRVLQSNDLSFFTKKDLMNLIPNLNPLVISGLLATPQIKGNNSQGLQSPAMILEQKAPKVYQVLMEKAKEYEAQGQIRDLSQISDDRKLEYGETYRYVKAKDFVTKAKSPVTIIARGEIQTNRKLKSIVDRVVKEGVKDKSVNASVNEYGDDEQEYY